VSVAAQKSSEIVRHYLFKELDGLDALLVAGCGLLACKHRSYDSALVRGHGLEKARRSTQRGSIPPKPLKKKLLRCNSAVRLITETLEFQN
jgi:hypothetical protein